MSRHIVEGKGRHGYALGDYGFSEAGIERDFGDYIRRRSIPKES